MDELFSAIGQSYKVGTPQLILLLLLFATFTGILLYLLGGRKRSQRIEDEKYSIFDDEDGLEARKSHKEDAKDGKKS